MTSNTNEQVAGGPIGKLVGKVKQAAGKVTDDSDLTREGRLQEAQSDAEVEAAQREAEARAEKERTDIERERLENEAERARLDLEVNEASRLDDAAAQRQQADEAERIAETIENKES